MTVTALGQVEFNGLLMPAANYEIQSIEGLADYPDVRTSDAVLLSRHGMHAGNDLLAGRKVTMTVAVHAGDATTFASAVTALRTAFLPAPDVATSAPTSRGDLPLTFRMSGLAGSANAILNCRPRRMAMSMDSKWNSGYAATAVIELFANDPLIYGTTQKTQSLTINAGSVSVTNAGNWPSLYQIQIGSITGPLTGATVQNNRIDVLKHLTLDGYSYATGDAVYILPMLRQVLFDANPAGGTLVDHYSKLSGDSRWWFLMPGANTIATSRTAGAATVTLTWYDTWV